MSWVRVWIHLVFTTKNREPYLNSHSIREQVFSHIKQNAESKDIWLDCANGYHNHIHRLISLDKEQTISNLAKRINGESSFWINKEKLIPSKFVWQDDFWQLA